MAERDFILNSYFDWMVRIVGGSRYRKLLGLMHNTAFVYILEMDSNRADDGLDLRTRFAWEYGLNEEEMEAIFSDMPCSVLEMMTALAQRCEEHITSDPEKGDRTREWFHEMLESLGLKHMTDDRFDKAVAAQVLERFLYRHYAADGRGGLFTAADGGQDMRTTEIWYQMMRYLNVKLYKNEMR